MLAQLSPASRVLSSSRRRWSVSFALTAKRTVTASLLLPACHDRSHTELDSAYLGVDTFARIRNGRLLLDNTELSKVYRKNGPYSCLSFLVPYRHPFSFPHPLDKY